MHDIKKYAPSVPGNTNSKRQIEYWIGWITKCKELFATLLLWRMFSNLSAKKSVLLKRTYFKGC